VSAELRAEWLPRSADEEWSRFVAASPTGSVYSLPAYLDALARAVGGRHRVLAVRKGDDLVGGVAVYERDTRLGTTVRPRLLLFYNGLVLREEQTVYPSERSSRLLRLAAALAEKLEGEGYAHVELRTRAPFADARPFQARGWETRPSYSYVVPLADLEAQWARTEQNLRRLVGRCERSGFELAVEDRFDDFYGLHASIHDRKGAPLYLPREAFAQFYDELRGKGLARLYHAVAPGGRVAASQLVLLGHPVVHTAVAATSAEHAASGAAAFLRWKGFEHLAGDGYVGNDLTDATLNPVTHFKSQLGGELETALVVTTATRRDRAVEAARGAARQARARVRARP
jgi:hypothetical protein